MHEVVQGLPVGPGHDRRQFDHGLVVFAGQEQPDEVLAQRGALLLAGEQVVEARTESVNRFGARERRLALRRHGTPPSEGSLAGVRCRLSGGTPCQPRAAQSMPQPDQPALTTVAAILPLVITLTGAGGVT